MSVSTVKSVFFKNSKVSLAILLTLTIGIVVGLVRAQTREVRFVIPAGTNQQLETGQADILFPDEVILTVGVKDTLVIENQDEVIHNFGPFVVGPRATFTKRFKAPVVYQGACSFHQEQQLRLVVNPAPWDLLSRF